MFKLVGWTKSGNARQQAVVSSSYATAVSSITYASTRQTSLTPAIFATRVLLRKVTEIATREISFAWRRVTKMSSNSSPSFEIQGSQLRRSYKKLSQTPQRSSHVDPLEATNNRTTTSESYTRCITWTDYLQGKVKAVSEVWVTRSAEVSLWSHDGNEASI